LLHLSQHRIIGAHTDGSGLTGPKGSSEGERRRVLFQEVNDVLQIMRTPVGSSLVFVTREKDMVTILAIKAANASERFRNVESFIIRSNWRVVENASKQYHGNRKVAPHRR